MRKSLTLFIGLALIGAAASFTPASASSGNATSAAAVPANSQAPEYLVLSARAVPPDLAERVIFEGTDRRGQQVAVVKSTRQETRAFADALPHRTESFADGTPKGGFVSFDTEAEALSAVMDQTATAAADPFTIDQQTQVKALIPQANGTNIYNSIKTLSTNWKNRYTHSNNAKQVANWLKGQYETMSSGKSYTSTEFYTGCSGCSAPVVMHTIKGAEKPDEYVVIGAHFDSIRKGVSDWNDNVLAPGADDNASGTSTILETLRVLHQNNWRPQRTVVFFSYSAEEIGLKGSRAAANWFKAQKKNVFSHMNIDMTNYSPSSRTRDITITGDYTDAALNQHMAKLVREYLPQYKAAMVDCGYQCSDHAPWDDAGYRSTGVSEPVLFQSLHTVNDTLANMGNTAEPSVKFSQLAMSYVVESAKTSTTSPTPTPTPSATPTPSPSVTPTPSPSTTPTPTATATNPGPVGGEIAVTNANVHEVVALSKSRPVIVVVGANWSVFTNKTLPLFRQKLGEDGKSWTLAYVDGAQYKTALANFHIKFYPTVIAYSDGAELADPARYADGTRDQASVNGFVDAAVNAWKKQH